MIKKSLINIRKKLLISITALTLSAILLSGCHGSKGLPEFEVPESFDTSRTYDITFWAKNDSNKVQAEVYKQAISDFHKLYPNINVNIKQYTDYSRIYNDVITNISTNTTPNVCITYPDNIATYITGINIVAPLNELMNDSSYGFNGSELLYDAPALEEIVEQFLNEGQFNDTYYAIPFMRSTEACYINKEYVEKLGYEVPDILTWDFIWEVSEKATEMNADGTYKLNGQNVLIPFIYKSTDNMLITMLKQKNAGYSTSEGEIEIFNDTTKEILNEVAFHTRTGAFSTFKISSYPANFLNAGQCVFAIDSTAGSTWMGADAPLSDIAEENKLDFTTVVRPVPQYDVDNPYMISQGPSLCIFNKEDPQEVLASWLFAQFLLTNDIQNSYSKSEGYVPVTYKARNSDQYQDYINNSGSNSSDYYEIKLEATNLLINNTDNTFVTPVFNGSASLRNAAGALVEDVAKSVRRKITVDDNFLETEFKQVTSLYRLDQLSSTDSNKKDLGPLPSTSIALLLSIFIAWFIILIIIISKLQKNKANSNN